MYIIRTKLYEHTSKLPQCTFLRHGLNFPRLHTAPAHLACPIRIFLQSARHFLKRKKKKYWRGPPLSRMYWIALYEVLALVLSANMALSSSLKHIPREPEGICMSSLGHPILTTGLRFKGEFEFLSIQFIREVNIKSANINISLLY